MADKKITELQLRSDVDEDVSLPADDGIQTYRVTAPQIRDFTLGQQKDPSSLLNYSLVASVGSSALTIALKNAVGNNPSSAAPVKFNFRAATAADGDTDTVSHAAALSTVISSGSTAGHVNGIADWLYIYAINNAGALELAWSSSPSWDEGSRQTTVAEGGAGAADARNVLYSTTQRTNVAVRLIGRMKSTQSTAGTWAAVPTEISLPPFNKEYPDVCIVSDHRTSGTSLSTATPGINTRVLNTIDNPKPWLSLGSNQITLQPGKYFVRASAPVGNSNEHKLLFTNTTDSVYAIVGDNNTSLSSVSEQKATLSGTFTIGAAKVFQLDHQINGGGEMGTAVSLSAVDEVYATVEIFKLL